MSDSLRSRLKAVREDVSAARDERAAARAERDQAREKFAQAQHEGAVHDWPEFKEAQEAVRKYGQAEDKLADATATEAAILEMLGEVPSDSRGNDGASTEQAIAKAFGWNGGALLAQDGSSYQAARDRGLFTSQNKFGTVHLGEIASRDEAVQFFSQGNATPGPITSASVGVGIQPDARGLQGLRLRPLRFLDLIPKGATDANSIEYVQVQAIPGTAAPVAEGSVKPETGLTLADAVAAVRTIAGWIKINRQALDDMAGLSTLINTLLPYDVQRKIEAQVLAGDGTGQNLRGILNTTGIGAPTTVAGDTYADAILRAMTAVILSDADPNFVAAHPTRWQDILMMRETGTAGTRAGAYLGGGPFSVTAPTIWGLALTPSTVIPVTTPLVGDSMGVTLLFREGVNVKTSDSDQDDFVRNRVTVLAEARVAAPVWRPASFALAPAMA